MTIFNLLLSTDKGVVPDSLPYIKMKPLYEETKAQLLFSRLEVMINASYEELLQKTHQLHITPDIRNAEIDIS